MENSLQVANLNTAMVPGLSPGKDKQGRFLPGHKFATGRKSKKNYEFEGEQMNLMGQEIDRMLFLMRKDETEGLTETEKAEFKMKEKLWLKMMDKIHPAPMVKLDLKKPILVIKS